MVQGGRAARRKPATHPVAEGFHGPSAARSTNCNRWATIRVDTCWPRAGEYYLLYCLDSRPQSVDLAGDRPYKVDLVDPWEMTVLPLGTARPGEYTVRPAKSDLAYRFTPYAPGEKLRPEAKYLGVSYRGHSAADRDVPQRHGRSGGLGFRRRRHVHAEPGDAHFPTAWLLHRHAASDRS